MEHAGKRPIAYLRKSKVSSDRHVSWEVQESEVRALAERRGDDVEVLSDWSRSGRGSKTRMRPEYLRLKAMIAAGDVSALYSYSLSRLARSTRELLELGELCAAANVPVRLAKEGDLDFTSPHGVLYLTVLAGVSTFEAEVARERAKDTLAVRRARGDHVGSAGYGQRLVRGQLRDDPREDLEAVVSAYREARSFSGAARILNAAGVRSKQGKAWSQTTVARTIRRETPGELAGRPVERGVSQRGAFALSRLLRCPCGQVMTGRSTSHTTKYGTYGPYASYQCHRGRYEPGHPRPYMVTERDVMPWIQAEAARLRIPERIAIGPDDAERERLRDRRQRVFDNYEVGAFDKAERDRRLQAIGDELERVDVGVRIQDIGPVDWTWPAEAVNLALRSTYFEYVELGRDLRPARAEWLVPEWREA